MLISPERAIKPVATAMICSLLIACQTMERTDPPAPAETVTASANQGAVRTIGNRTMEDRREDQSIDAVPEVFDSTWERISAGFQLQEYYLHAEVDAQLNSYRGNQRLFDLIGSRASPFLYQIVEEIEKRELPMELALLPIVESTYNPQAHSSENAVGLWQILSNTGRSLGLQQDWWYDARRDPLTATVAALDYMQALLQQFDGNWLLALAAYNTGPGNVQRALRRSQDGNQEFWSLRLAPETRYHVPKLLALARIVADPARYEIELPEIPNENAITRVDIGSQIDLIRVAELLDMEESDLRALNPGYLQWATHPESPQSVTIPSSREASLQAGLASLDRSQFVTWEHYQIRSGDTLSTIARRLNTTVDVLSVVNKLQDSRIIAGDALLIPRGSGAQDYASLTLPALQQRRIQPVPDQYTIRAGDNLWLIARRFDLRSKEIAAWNSMSVDTVLFPGQTLDLSFASQVQDNRSVAASSQQDSAYTVVRGDNPARIAQMFDIELSDFLRWNNLSSSSIIYPGQQVFLAPSQ